LRGENKELRALNSRLVVEGSTESAALVAPIQFLLLDTPPKPTAPVRSRCVVEGATAAHWGYDSTQALSSSSNRWFSDGNADLAVVLGTCQ
jgi:hypothetical protein